MTAGFSVFNLIPVQERMMSNADQRKREEAQRRTMTKEEREAERAERAALRELARAERIVAREERRAARAARAAESGIVNRMSALRDAKKNYTKSATGQLRTSDELAVALDAVEPHEVIRIALRLLQLEANPYEQLNTGQQSMNLRNKLRGAIRRGTISIDDVIRLRDA
jgi:hypothetical protein